MSEWVNKINIREEWDKASEGDIGVDDLSEVIVQKLSNIDVSSYNEWIVEEYEGLLDSFKDLAGDPDPEEDEFNSAMYDLYNWGDIPLDTKFGGKKLCWISTM